MADNQSDKINPHVQNSPGSSSAQDPEIVVADRPDSRLGPGTKDTADSKSLDAESTGKCVDLDEALQLAEDNHDKWMRAVADLENYKKRSINERSKLLKYKNEDLLRDLLVVVDNLDRAVSAPVDHGSSALLEGVKMTATMFRDVLGRYGVSPIESVGQTFNPEFHEAIATFNDPKKEPNTVLEELEKGYMYQDRLLRPAKVVVSTK
ncbi:MAG: nucleotide exchange factor GrpE [Desulfomonilaceae bacterium]